jgi:hypothetical protein
MRNEKNLKLWNSRNTSVIGWVKESVNKKWAFIADSFEGNSYFDIQSNWMEENLSELKSTKFFPFHIFF